MKNEILKGTVILVIAGIIVKILGALYRIPLSNILGAEGIGVYQMIFPVFSLVLIICSSGVSATLSLLIARARAKKNENIKKIFLKGFFYCLFFSILFSIVFFLLADEIAVLQGNASATTGYRIMIFALLFASLLSPFRGLFQGYSNMIPTAVSQMLEQIFKVFLGLFFAVIFTQKGIEFGVAGAFLGIGIAETVAFLYLLIKFLLFKKSIFNKELHIKKSKIFTQKKESENLSFAKINLSITISSLIIPLVMTFDSFVVINLLNLSFSEQISTALYGLQSGLVNSLINFPIIISTALSMSLLPSLTFLISKKKNIEVNEKMKEIFKTIWIIALPCIVVFIIFSDLIMKILYGVISPQMLSIASILLKISAIEILFISILQVSIAIFQSFGKEKTPIFILAFCAIVKILLTLFWVRNPNINIYGVALANLIFYALSASISLFLIKRKFKFFLDFKFFSVTLLSILISSIFFYEINVFIIDFWTKLSLIVITGILFYIIPLFLFGIIDLEKLGVKKRNNKK